ncbi:PAS domain-containing sensor histidine kinase [Methylorubrum zatmanii]
MDGSGAPSAAWPVGGDMADRICAFDWTATGLGPIETWPPCLRATISLLLSCGFPMIALWGEQLTQIYNDGYRDLMGLKHPDGLGQPSRECWPEVWHINEPIYRRVWAGETCTFEDGLYPITRSGSLEDAWFTLTYSPLRDDLGQIAGILVTLVETTARVLSERALRESEARYRALVTAGTSSVYRMSPDWRQMHELIGRGFLADVVEPCESWADRYILPEDRGVVNAVIAEAKRTRSLFELEHRVRCADGSIGWTFSRAVPMVGLDGEIVEWFGTASDVTERKDAEAALRESEDRFRAELERQVRERTAELQASRDLLQATMDSSMDMIQVFEAVRDEAGEIVDFRWLLNNHTSESRYGEVRGESLLERNPGVEQEGIFDAFKQVTETGLPSIAERRYDHEQFSGWFFQSAVKLGDGVATTTKDISAWKAAQEEVLRLRDEIAQAALRESEDRFRALASLIPVLLWRSDVSGQHNSANEPWLTYTGQTLAQSQGGGWLEAIHPDDRAKARDAFETGRGKRQSIEVQQRIRRADGQYRWFLVRQAPIVDAEGQLTQWIGAAMDIHDLHELQERQAVLVAELQHRTRNLLGVVRSIAHQTMVQTGPTTRFREQFSDRLAALSRVQGLLSRSEQEPITLQALIQTELNALGIDDFAERIFLSGPPVRLRKASVQTLALALHELATNARKHGALTTAHGRLSVTWHAEPGQGEEERLLLEWVEDGISRAREEQNPTRRGYGRELIERAMPYVLDAKTRYELGETRLFCSIDMPLGARARERDEA